MKTFGKRDLEEVYQEINTIESIPTWAAIDTRIGVSIFVDVVLFRYLSIIHLHSMISLKALTIHLDEFQCFDAEVYADEIEPPPEDYELREDYRGN